MTDHPGQLPARLAEPPEVRDRRADDAIRRHMGLAMGGGALPVPLLDLAAVTAVQLNMLKRLAAIYEVPFEGGSSRAFLTSLTAALGGTTVARMGASLAKSVPGVGTIGGIATQVALTGATTYAVGQLFKRMFQEGRRVESLEVSDVREEAAGYLDAGVDRAQAMLDSVRRRRAAGDEEITRDDTRGPGDRRPGWDHDGRE